MNRTAACGRNIMARRDGSGIEIDAPAGALSPNVLDLLREHWTSIEKKLMPVAGRWLRIGELDECGELQTLLDGRVDETVSAELFPAAGPVQNPPVMLRGTARHQTRHPSFGVAHLGAVSIGSVIST